MTAGVGHGAAALFLVGGVVLLAHAFRAAVAGIAPRVDRTAACARARRAAAARRSTAAAAASGRRTAAAAARAGPSTVRRNTAITGIDDASVGEDRKS